MRKTPTRSLKGKLVVTKGLVLAAALAATPVALAGDFVCTGPASGSFDNVVVPAGMTCELSNASVEGSVKVYGALDVLPTTTIRGSIDGEPGHDYVLLDGSPILVRGSMQLKGSTLGNTGGYQNWSSDPGRLPVGGERGHLNRERGERRGECQGGEEHRRRGYHGQHHWWEP